MAKRFLTPLNFANLSSDPDEGTVGDIYYNIESDKFRYYDGEDWNNLGTGSGSGITVSETAPSDPSQGDAWFKESTNTFYIYDDTYWIEVATTISLYLIDDPNPTLSASMSASGYGIENIGYLNFDTSTLVESVESRLKWDSDFGTLSIGMEGGDVELPIGQKQGAYVKNKSGVNIEKGKAVQFAGAHGGKIEIEKAVSNGTVPSKYMFGITAEAIDDDDFGFVVTEGYIRGINTSGRTIGDLLYFDPNTPGNLTATEPPSTAFNIPIAAVTFVNANAGVIYVRMNMEYKLKEIEDIQLTSPQNGDVLVYNSASALWNNAPTVSSLSGTANQVNVSASTGLITLSLPSTINVNTSGSAAKLTTSRTIALSGDISGSAAFDGSASAGISTTLANSGVSASTYGSASAIPVLVVDEKGRITSASVAGVEGLPDQTGNEGKYLTTDGTEASWEEVGGGGAKGGGTDEIFWENGQSITTNYTITSQKNAGTFGPVEIDSGVTVEIPAGSVWVIV
jgi:hypothetical protein